MTKKKLAPREYVYVASMLFGMSFTCLLYLTIGPFFAIPHCATTSFTVGLEQILPEGGNLQLYLLLFSAIFFAAALFFSLRPGKLLTDVGKILTPFFLLFLGVLVIAALLGFAIGLAIHLARGRKTA